MKKLEHITNDRHPKVSGYLFSLVRRVYGKVFSRPTSFYLNKELARCKSCMDLGCGNHSPIAPSSKFLWYVGVDIYRPHLLKNKGRNVHKEYILGDVQKIEFKLQSFDCVVAKDLLEHLTKKEGYKLIKKMESMARRKVMILTTNGFLKQPSEAIVNNAFQVHRSGWTTKEFKELGYEIRGTTGLRVLRGERAVLRFRPTILWRIFSEITQKVTYYFPEFAFHLLCIKSF